jgi:hypothetical protein
MNQSQDIQMARKWLTFILPITAAMILLLSCSLFLSPATNTPTPTNTPLPTDTPIPTDTSEPTATKKAAPANTRKPTEVPRVTLNQFRQALTDAGYTSIVLSSGEGSVWTLDNPFENIYPWNDGEIQLSVLNSLRSRMSHMEQKFKILDDLFSSGFMAKLRKDNQDYAAMVGAGVAGKPSQTYGPVPGDIWKYQSAFYNIFDDRIGSYKIQFALWFEQWTCPVPAGYVCYFPDFANQQFTG